MNENTWLFLTLRNVTCVIGHQEALKGRQSSAGEQRVCNTLQLDLCGLAFEAESHRVGSNDFELDCSRYCFPDHCCDEFFDEYGEVEVDVVMNGVEMHLSVITVLVGVEVAAPKV